MKKKTLIMTFATVLVMVGIVGVFFLISNRNTMDTPELVEVREMTEEQAKNRLTGESRDNIIYSWGEPDGHLSGLWGDIWSLEEKSDRHIILYYDEDSVVEKIKIDEHY